MLKPFCYDIHASSHSSHLEDFQLLAHLEPLLQVSLCHGLLSMVWPLPVCPSVTFHILDVYMMDPTGAIFKVFNCYLLLKRMSDGAKTWWKAWGQHGDLESIKLFRFDIQDGHHGSHLETLLITSAPES